MSIKLTLKVIPGGSREQVLWFGTGLKVKVLQAPEKGLANRAVEKLLARTLGLPESAVRIVSGLSSQQKLVEIDGIDVDTIQQVLRRTQVSKT